MTEQADALPQAEARPSEGEVGEAVKRLKSEAAWLEMLARAVTTSEKQRPKRAQHASDLRALLAENDEIRAANFRWVAKCQAMFAAKEAAESKLSVLVEEIAGVVEALTADDYEALDDLPKLQPVEFTGHITWRFTPAVRDLIVKLTTRALASLQSPQEPTP